MLEEFKVALDIIQSLKSFFSVWSKSSPTQGQEVSSQLLKLQSFLEVTNKTHSAHLEHIRQLEAEIAQLKDWTKEKKLYELRQEKGSRGGTFPMYSLRDELVEQGEEPHHICAECYENGKKSILSFVNATPGIGGLMPHCPIHEWGMIPVNPSHL